MGNKIKRTWKLLLNHNHYNTPYASNKKLVIKLNKAVELTSKIILVLAQGGSGKTTFINHILPVNVGLKNKIYGYSIDVSLPTLSFFNDDQNTFNLNIEIEIARICYGYIGGIIRSDISNKTKQSQSWSSNDDFSDIKENILTKKLFSSKFANVGMIMQGNLYIDPEDFKIAIVDFMNQHNLESITLDLFSLNYILFSQFYLKYYFIESTKKAFSESRITLQTFVRIIQMADFYSNPITPKIGILNNFSSSVNLFLTNNSNLKLFYENVKYKTWNNQNQEVETTATTLFIVKDGEKYCPDLISDTEKAILWSSLLQAVCKNYNIDLTKTLLVFDEVDAKIDPQHITKVIDILSNLSGKIIIATHSFITFKHFQQKYSNELEIISPKILPDNENLIIALDKINLEEKKDLNRQMLRLTGGYTVSNDTDSYISSFENIYEDNIVICEGVTDVKLFNLVKKELLRLKILDKNLRKILLETRFISFFDDPEDLVGGAGKIPSIMQGRSDYLIKNNKNLIGIFDFDEAGVKAVSNGLFAGDLIKGLMNGKLQSWKGKKNQFYYLLQRPKQIISTCGEFTIEHLLYGKGMPDFDSKFKEYKFPTNKKQNVSNSLINHLETLITEDEVKELLSEFIILFSRLPKVKNYKK
jgi:AAA domain, putative AbiEii toxin, Type IV TA system